MKKQILVIIFAITSGLGHSQDSNTNLANQKFNDLAYMDAIGIYETIVEKGYGNPEIFLSLANSYYFNAKYVEANRCFEKLFASGAKTKPETYYRYSQTLKSTGNVEKSNSMLKQFSQLKKNDKRSLFFKDNTDYLLDIERISNRFKLENSAINTEYIDYGGAFYKQDLIYTSTKPQGSDKQKNKWINQPYSDLYKSKAVNNKLVGSEIFDKNINTKFNESGAIFTDDGATMYFTKNNFNKGEAIKNSKGIILVKIYKATLINNQWMNVTELSFNSNEFNCAHPTLSSDENTLYFSSDMPGGYGLSDIYKIEINGDGTFEIPINMGDKINTAGKETFPFIKDNNELYFSSDGHLGLGGLDVFAAKISENGQISKILNVGKPVNSAFDDFGYAKDVSSQMGVVSSNRPGGKGFDDIYTFIDDGSLPFDCKQTITGVVKDNDGTTVIKKATVILLDDKMKEIATQTTDEKGFYEFLDLECDTEYFVRVEAGQYQTDEISVKTAANQGRTATDFSLTKRFIEIKENLDLAKVFDIANINFIFNDWHITAFSEQKMFVLLSVLEKYPILKIKIGAHTDSNGSDQFNLKLSSLRAKETKSWLVSKGISTKRITTQGFGETKILNNCTNGVPCKNNEHLVNRRSEFLIVK